jgi:hypothetical protein
VRFGHLHRDENVADYYSEEFDSINWDEASHFTRFMRTEMEIRLRAPNSRRYRLQMRYGSNPGNVGHYDFKREFVRPSDRDVELLYYWDTSETSYLLDGTAIEGKWMPFPPGFRGTPAPYIVWRPEPDEVFDEINRQRALLGDELMEGMPSRCYIPSRLQDNTYLFNDPAYIVRQVAKLSPQRLRAMIGGDWDAIEGQYFESFDPRTHVIPADYLPKPGALCWRSLDWGQAAPLACYWHTYDQDSRWCSPTASSTKRASLTGKRAPRYWRVRRPANGSSRPLPTLHVDRLPA